METVENSILNELLERLREAGAVAEVVSPNLLDEYRPKDRQAIVTTASVNANGALSCQGNPPAQAWDIEYSIIAVVRQAEGDTKQIEDKLNDFTGDVLKGITKNSSVFDWFQFNGNAINANLRTITKDVAADGSMMSNNIGLVVTYRTDENNPFNRR